MVKKKTILRLARGVLLLLGLLSWACISDELALPPPGEEQAEVRLFGQTLPKHRTMAFYWAESDGIRNVLRRASQLATIKWTPVNAVPYNKGYWEASIERVGIPYSSTKQINKYVGLDVSFHTFMTAVHNPYSVLYTEDLSKPPYYGVNCATYYGDVCSTCVDYALGITIPYTANQLVRLPEFELLEDQSISNLKPGDVLHCSGHVYMIFKIIKDDNGIVSTITCFESAGSLCRIYNTSNEDLEKRIAQDNIQVYRYKLIDSVKDYVPSAYVPVGDEHFPFPTYNESLCPNRGDQSVYRTDEDVVVNVFGEGQRQLIVENSKGEQVLFDGSSSVVVGNLAPDVYKAFVVKDGRESDYVSFIVSNPTVKVETDDMHHVSFSCSNGDPLYCVLCNKEGGFYYTHPLSKQEIAAGIVELEPLLDKTSYYCKVVFQTEFGTVINEPIRIK